MTANTAIETMNRLWITINSPGSSVQEKRNARNEFARCQQWLSNQGHRYYQDSQTKKWKLS